jgi:hypothetical protein
VSDPIALQFVRFVLEHNPGVTEFATLYDAMARAASHRSFCSLGYQELREVGISFALTHLDKLEALVHEACATSTSTPSQPQRPQTLQ